MPATGRIISMMQCLTGMDDADYLRHLVLYQAAPTVRGMKPASLICPRGNGRQHGAAWRTCRRDMENTLGLTVECLREDALGLMLLAYRPELLGRALSHPEARTLLTENGYDAEEADLDPLIRRLREKCRDPRAFPHEIGLFLGYPPHDVRCFMTLGGCQAKATGSWQAYGDLQQAQKHFARCREAMDHAANAISAGTGFRDAAREVLWNHRSKAFPARGRKTGGSRDVLASMHHRLADITADVRSAADVEVVRIEVPCSA